MNQALLNTVTRLLGISNVFGFFLVLARISPLFILAPVFSSQMLVPRVRSVLAVAMTLALTPLALRGAKVPNAALPLVGLLVSNFLVGLALAYAVSCVFAAVQAAGVLADNFSGFSFGQMVDPINGNPGGALTNLYTIVGLVLFLAIGGDAWILRGLNATFTAVPVGDAVLVQPLASAAESAFSGVLLGGVEIAAPLILALVISDVAFGLVSRVVPQLNVFAVGFPMKIGIGLIVTAVTLPFFANWIANQIGGTLMTAIDSLRI
jgi:flagellar biosynthetic protein FliR